MRRLGVTVVCGFLGAGKSAVLTHLLRSSPERRFAVLINEIGRDDRERWRAEGASEVVTIADGCICCDRRDELVDRVAELARASRFDHLVIEASGIAESMPIAEALAAGLDDVGLSKLIRLDTLVTVLDAETFLTEFESTDSLEDRGVPLDEDDDRTLVHLLVNQAEFANVLVLNKADRIDEGQLEALEALLRELNPDARLLRASHGRIQASEVIGARRFQGWRKGVGPIWAPRPADRPLSANVYGLSSFVFHARRPFHPERLAALMEGEALGPVLRSKGLVWVATRNDFSGLWSLAGRVCLVSPLGYWAASVPRDDWPDGPDFLRAIKTLWQAPYGDRRTEIVLIGQNMDHAAITAALEECLLDDAEMILGPEGWSFFSDPLPEWVPEEEEEDSDWISADPAEIDFPLTGDDE